MSECIVIAIVGALINMVLALLIPCLLKNTKQPILVNIKKVYDVHKQVIITSSVIVFVTIYLALKLSPELGFSFDNEISLNPLNDLSNVPKYSFNTRNSNDLFNLRNNDDLFNGNQFKIINLSKL
jgi:hypothetical protein